VSYQTVRWQSFKGGFGSATDDYFLRILSVRYRMSVVFLLK
jgi:hypothetical protein